MEGEGGRPLQGEGGGGQGSCRCWAHSRRLGRACRAGSVWCLVAPSPGPSPPGLGMPSETPSQTVDQALLNTLTVAPWPLPSPALIEGSSAFWAKCGDAPDGNGVGARQ